MAHIYLPDGNVHAPEHQDLAKQITYGDGVAWTGDPRLWLGLGVVTERVSGRTMTRLEVWRHNEDGSDALIGHWHPSEAGRVCADLAEMRLGRPGAVDVCDRIDAHNDRLEAAASAAREDALAVKLERAAYVLMRAQGNARNRFAVNGRRDA